jgi:cobalt-zinc-cadmium resistance protein CzcA
MLERLVAFSLQNRLLVLLTFAIAAAVGVWRLTELPVDAFPDTSPVQVQVNTTAAALNAEEIEQQLTLPVELAISGLPGLVNVRSISKFGLSQVVAVFDDDTDVYDARQFIMERLNTVELPEGIERPQLGPISTGLGEVLHYILRSEDPDRSLEEIRTLHDWVVKPELMKVSGVAEVNSWGGFEKQFHVIVSPDALLNYGLTLQDVEEALRRNNANVGGGLIDRSGESLLVHGLGQVSNVEEIGNIVIVASGGTPVHVHDVAEVRVDHEIRRGAVTFQGQGEALLGLGFMLLGENSNEVAAALRNQLEAVSQALPEDIVIDIVYDRTGLVEEVIGTVQHNLVLGAILVVVVLFVLLGNLRAGLLVAAAIPIAMLFAVLGMYEMSIAASLLSLGAIDFGILVDGSVVMTETNLRRLREEQARLGRKLTRAERLACTIKSSQEIVRPIVFGMLIILLVFVPILMLEGVEGKMFQPMAWTFILALIGALVVALFLSPVLSYYGLPFNARPERKGIAWLLASVYGVLLHGALRLRWVCLLLAVALIGFGGWTATRLGAEFTPRLSEGALVANVIRLAGVSIPTSAAYNTRIEQLLLEEFPDEMRYVWTRIGSAEVATDPMGTELSDVFMTLHPREEWTRADSQADLLAQVEEKLAGLPGLNIAYSQPIELRMNELASGMRADVGIQIFGDDFDELVRISNEVQRVLLEVEGAADISVDQLTGQPTLQVKVDQARIARQGIPASDVLDFVEALGGKEVGRVFEGQRVFPLVLRLPDEYRRNVDALASARIMTEAGPQLELQQLADVVETTAPATINREWSRRMIRVQTNVRDRDVGSFVAEAQQQIADQVDLPPGYIITWGGQFENLQRAQLRLMIIVPLTLLLVFMLLYFSLGSLRDVLIIYTGVPFAALGGIFALYLRDIPFSVSAAVGFIALSGIAVLNGQVLVAAIRAYLDEGKALRDAVLEAGKQRLRPVLATAITDAAGFIPMAISTGVGAEVQRPLATVVVGGVLTGTMLTLFLLPILYLISGKRNSPSGPSSP